MHVHILHLVIFKSTAGMFKLKAVLLEKVGIFQSKVDVPVAGYAPVHIQKALRRLEQIVETCRWPEHDSNQEINVGNMPTSANVGHNQGGAWSAR